MNESLGFIGQIARFIPTCELFFLRKILSTTKKMRGVTQMAVYLCNSQSTWMCLTMLSLPSNSSNMSSIENLWYLFDWVVFAMDPQSHFFTQFVTALQSELLNIPVNTVRKLINLILARHAVVRSPKEGYSSSTFFKYIITYIQLFILMWLDCVYATDSQLFKSALLSFVFTE